MIFYSGIIQCHTHENNYLVDHEVEKINHKKMGCKNEQVISEKKAYNFRRPMPEGDKINADEDLVSSSDECSSQGLLELCQNDVVSLDIGSTNENARGGKRNSSKGCTTTKQDENSQPKWKRNRMPNDSEKTNIQSTCNHFLDEKGAMVTTNLKRNSESERNERRLRNPSPLVTGRNFNPNRYRFMPKIKKEEVEATDNKNASVQKISEWLGNDPFGNKKQILIRQEAKIMIKAKAFEHEEVFQMRNKDVVSGKELRHFPVGKVSQGKKWLQSAFGETKEEDDSSSVSMKKKKYEYVLKQSKR